MPYRASLVAPTPGTFASSCSDVGSVSAIATNVASVNTQNAGNDWSFADLDRHSRRLSKIASS